MSTELKDRIQAVLDLHYETGDAMNEVAAKEIAQLFDSQAGAASMPPWKIRCSLRDYIWKKCGAEKGHPDTQPNGLVCETCVLAWAARLLADSQAGTVHKTGVRELAWEMKAGNKEARKWGARLGALLGGGGTDGQD